MSKKKLSSLSDLSGFVFSTNDEFELEPNEAPIKIPNNQQKLKALFSNKGRGGKTVTIITGFVGPEEDLKTLGKMLKSKCGVGGSVKDGDIIIQGKFRDKIMDILQKEGYSVKRVGG